MYSTLGFLLDSLSSVEGSAWLSGELFSLQLFRPHVKLQLFGEAFEVKVCYI